MQKITIITINLNNAFGLKNTIESVILQTYKNIEYIVIDGASTDGSVEIIKEFENKIKYWISEPDAGIYNAMNKGILKATGEYLLFLNSGDYLFKKSILTDIFHNTIFTTDIIYGNQFRFSENKTRINVFPEKLTFYWFYTEFIGHNSTFINRNLFTKVGLYNENYKVVSDWEFLLLSICKHNCTTKYIDIVVSAMEDGGISNNSSSGNLVKFEREKVLLEHFPYFLADYQELYRLKYNTLLRRIKTMIKKYFIQTRNGK